MSTGILSVTQINRYISFKFKEDVMLKGRMVKGEISNLVCHTKSGHVYFTLKDSESSIRAVMFRNFAQNLKFELRDGMSIIVLANIQVYEKDGQYQLYVMDIQPSGIGALYLQVEQLKQKLAMEGVFDEDRKKPLPPFPEKIGIITAGTGAALQDMINIISRRFPVAEILLFSAYVQGENAPESIAAAIKIAQSTDCNILIVGRGGGSYEDLMPFNSEIVVRAIYNSFIPVISAVGHETDVTLSDFAADLRAPTPSAAAELCVPDMNVLENTLEQFKNTIDNRMTQIFYFKNEKLRNLENKLSSLSYITRFNTAKLKYDQDEERLINTYKSYILNLEQKFDFYKGKLEALNPENILSRGFSLIYADDKLINSAEQLSDGQKIRIKLGKGEVIATVDSLITGK